MSGLVEVGTRAPELGLPDQHGTPVTLADLDGAPALVLFFPGAFSGVCTGELRELRENAERVAATGTRVLVVSCDPPHAQRAWAEQEGLDVPVLSDFWPHGRVSAEYGAFNDATGRSQRAAVLLDGAGTVRWTLLNPPGEARPFAAYLDAIAAL